MEYVKFTDFRNHSKEYFDEIEKGKTFVIIRKGEPVARITPFRQVSQGWKRDNRKIKLNGKKTTLDYISEERRDR